MTIGVYRPADILVPTCKAAADVAALIREVKQTMAGNARVIASCQPVSAAVNRNWTLDRATTSLVVMLDDDVTGFGPGWNKMLTDVLEHDPDVVMVSADLRKPDGSPSQMLGGPARDKPGLVEVPKRELPTACFAFRNDGTRFDEEFLGSGWEDTSFGARLRTLYPQGRFVMHAGVKVVHLNEQKNQGPHFWENKRRYEALWGAPQGNYGHE